MKIMSIDTIKNYIGLFTTTNVLPIVNICIFKCYQKMSMFQAPMNVNGDVVACFVSLQF